MLLKVIRNMALFGVFIFPFAVVKSFAFPLAFSHVVFIFTLIELAVLLFLFHSLEKGELVFRKSYLTLALLFYIIVLFITAWTGVEFTQSFWSSYLRFTGIITWLHHFSFLLVISSVFTEEKDWKKLFRALAISGAILGLLSFLGVYGLNLKFLAFLDRGGSFLGNTSYSGAYCLLIFFFSFIGLSFETKKEWKIAYIVSLLLIFFNPDLFNFGIWNGSVGFGQVFRNPILLVGIARTSSLVLWAGGLLTVAIYLLHRLKNKTLVLRLATALIIGMSVVYVTGFALLMSEGRVHDFYVKQSGPVRLMVWDMAIQGIKEKPILGYGDGNFKYVYQNYLKTEMIHLEDPPWFDSVHNFTLGELIGHGVLGALCMLSIFILIVFISFRLYAREKRFFFLFIPFIFFLHFLQLQTFFQVDSTLFLTFLLLAFLISRQTSSSVKIPWRKNVVIYQIGVLILVLGAFIFYVIMPIRENLLIPFIKNTKPRSERLQLEAGLKNLSIDPFETLRQVSMKFMDDTALNATEIQKAGYIKNVAEEYKAYLDSYDQYLPRYSHYHRYLFEYANLINSAFIFGVDELKKGEDMARQSLEISKAYPYPYWILATNLYYQGRVDEALLYAKQGYDLDPTIERSAQIYDNISMRAKSKSKTQSFFYIPTK